MNKIHIHVIMRLSVQWFLMNVIEFFWLDIDWKISQVQESCCCEKQISLRVFVSVCSITIWRIILKHTLHKTGTQFGLPLSNKQIRNISEISWMLLDHLSQQNPSTLHVESCVTHQSNAWTKQNENHTAILFHDSWSPWRESTDLTSSSRLLLFLCGTDTVIINSLVEIDLQREVEFASHYRKNLPSYRMFFGEVRTNESPHHLKV